MTPTKAWPGPVDLAEPPADGSKQGGQFFLSDVVLSSDAGRDERKSVTRTFRFPESLARSLEKEAADEGKSVSALVNSIVSWYLNWEKKGKEFGLISLDRSVFMSLIKGLNNEALARVGREVMVARWKEMAEFFFQDSSPDKVLEVLSMMSRADPDRLRTTVTKKEDTYTIVCRHDFGPKLSVVLKSAVQELVRQSFHVKPQITAGNSVVTARFKANPQNLPS